MYQIQLPCNSTTCFCDVSAIGDRKCRKRGGMAGDDDMENGVPEVPEVSSARARLMELDSRRLRIESEAAAIVARLEGMQGEPGLTGALVDADGFPRSDVDIIAVRRERQRHAVLQTDMSAVMSEIAQELATMHTAARDAGAVSSGRPPAGRAPSGAGLGDGAPRENGEAAGAPGLESATPLAVISGIVPGSPAETGGPSGRYLPPSRATRLTTSPRRRRRARGGSSSRTCCGRGRCTGASLHRAIIGREMGCWVVT